MVTSHASVPRLRHEPTAPTDDAAVAMAETFKLLGDLTRVRILTLLMQREACVHELASAITVSPSAISHQLRLLRVQRLVRRRRKGREVFYALDDEHVRHLLAASLRHSTHG